MGHARTIALYNDDVWRFLWWYDTKSTKPIRMYIDPHSHPHPHPHPHRFVISFKEHVVFGDSYGINESDMSLKYGTRHFIRTGSLLGKIDQWLFNFVLILATADSGDRYQSKVIEMTPINYGHPE